VYTAAASQARGTHASEPDIGISPRQNQPRPLRHAVGGAFAPQDRELTLRSGTLDIAGLDVANNAWLFRGDIGRRRRCSRLRLLAHFLVEFLRGSRQ
jgi:hypothetical protein